MMAAIKSAEDGSSVTILEKMQTLGRKLLITGKGRCNITSNLDIKEFISNMPGNGMFLYSSFNNFTNIDLINFLKVQGLEVKTERGNRVFPVTDKSVDVLNVLLKRMKELKVEIKTNTAAKEIITEDNVVVGVMCRGDQWSSADVQCTPLQTIHADKIILATGGKSYPLTGSTGDGYKLAKDLGHSITELKASLVPLETYDLKTVKELQGLSLKNVRIKFKDCVSNKIIYDDFGEMLFTHFGVSGPTILSASAHLLRYKNIKEKLKSRNIVLQIDLKPALTHEKLDIRIRKDFEEIKNKQFKNGLGKLLPVKLINIIIYKSEIDPNKKINEITKEDRMKLIRLLKNFELNISNFRPIEEAIITAGGINIKEINPSTMESKIVKNLYFAGEIIDVDAYTGGFNLQIAFSTGYTAGRS